MWPLIVVILIIISLIWIFVHTNPKTVLRYNTKCEKCGKSKGFFKCQMCRI